MNRLLAMYFRKYTYFNIALYAVLFFSIILVLGLVIDFNQIPLVSGIFSFFFYISVLLFNLKFKYIHKSSKIYILLCTITLIMIVRHNLGVYDFIREALTSPYVFLPFILIFLVPSYEYKSQHEIERAVVICMLLHVLLLIISFDRLFSNEINSSQLLENINHFFGYPAFYILFARVVSYKAYKILASISIGVGLIASIYLARRGMALTYTFGIFIFILLEFRNGNYSIFKRDKIIPFVFITCLGFYLFVSWDTISVALIDRLYEDSRSTVIDSYHQAMSYLDWIFGKGISGSYYTGIYSEDEITFGNRNIVEVGYLFLILYGGILYFLLFVYLNIISIYRIIHSSYFEYYGFAGVMIVSTIELAYAGVPFFDLKTLIVWVGIWIGVNSKIKAI